MNKLTTLTDIRKALVASVDFDEVTQSNNSIILTYQGIPVVAVLTDEDIPRLHFSVDVGAYAIGVDINQTLMYMLLELNTEITPVAIGIDTTSDGSIIRALVTLQVIDLQESEVVSAFDSLLGNAPSIARLIKTFK